MSDKTYRVEGMTCGGCVASVTKALAAAGLGADVELEGGRVTVRGPHEREAVRDAVEGAGFDFVGEA